MRILVIAVECLIITFCLCTVTGLDYDEDRTHFDLSCHGSGHDSFQQPQSSMRISLDLELAQFCIDDFCDKLTRVDDAKLEYHCHAKEMFCDSGMGTGGPFVSQEDFVLDRASGQFSRTSSGSVGDLDHKPFTSTFSGTCALAPFSGPLRMKR